jgi:ribosomal subunit interface protein
MQIAVQGKQLDLGDALRGHVEDTITDIAEKYFSNPIDATVTLSREGGQIKADIQVRVGKGIQVRSEAAAKDAHGAFDAASEKVAKRLRRYKRRLRDHHLGHAEEAVLPAQQYVLAAEDEAHNEPEADSGWQPVVVAEMQTGIDQLTVGEAVMRMDLGDLPAMMFQDRKTGRMNMVYRRVDGNIGWVDPAGSE